MPVANATVIGRKMNERELRRLFDDDDLIELWYDDRADDLRDLINLEQDDDDQFRVEPRG